MVNKTRKIKKLIEKWQLVLGLEDWVLDVKFVDFNRKDYLQSGDIEVDIVNKKAIILFANNPQKDDEYIVVHELVHLLFWKYDHFCENLIPENKKSRYFELLEETAAKITSILLQKEN